MNRPLPILATLLGIAGLLPFIGTGLAAIGPQSDRATMALVAYGAVILAFLGGVHWGFALEDPTGRSERARLALGVAPALVGWVALLMAMALGSNVGLLVILLGVLGTTVVESRARRVGLMPHGYMLLRYGLSAGVVVVVAMVLMLRLLGAHLTLW